MKRGQYLPQNNSEHECILKTGTAVKLRGLYYDLPWIWLDSPGNVIFIWFSKETPTDQPRQLFMWQQLPSPLILSFLKQGVRLDDLQGPWHSRWSLIWDVFWLPISHRKVTEGKFVSSSPWVTLGDLSFLHGQAWMLAPSSSFASVLDITNSRSRITPRALQRRNGGTWEDSCLDQVHPHSA